MNKFTEFTRNYSLIISLCLVIIAVLFSLGCDIYVAITNPFVGIVGIIGSLASLGIIALWVYLETISQK